MPRLSCSLTMKNNASSHIATPGEIDQNWMKMALNIASLSAKNGEVPVGAVVVKDGEIIGKSGNRKETLKTPIGHAELIAIHKASQKLQSWRLSGCTLYVTLEPCVMCAGVITQARVDRVVFGAYDPKGGAMVSLFQIGQDSRLNHRCEIVGGILESECSQILTRFFKERRKAKK